MRKKDRFPFIMTRKSLVVYIVFTVLLGLFLFFAIGDMAGKCAACIVCPMLIASKHETGFIKKISKTGISC